MTQCTNPRCSRQAPLTTTAFLPYWEDEGAEEDGQIETPVCVPCYLAIECGSAGVHNEVTFAVRDHSLLSESDRDALTGS